MTGAATGARARIEQTGIDARIGVAEPQGERVFDGQVTIGGEGAQVVVPGSPVGAVLRIERREAAWTAQPLDTAHVALDGRTLAGPRALRQDDVLAVGAAQIVVTALSRTVLDLCVAHVAGNATVAPASILAEPGLDEGDVEIVAEPAAFDASLLRRRSAPQPLLQRWRAHSRRNWAWAAAAMALVVIAAFVSTFEPVALVVQPSDARVRAADTRLAFRRGSRIFLRPGSHVLDAERAGYAPGRVDVVVQPGRAASVRILLEKLPGRLRIDTGGIAAVVSVDGARIGSVPGELRVPAGRRVITLRAPGYFDYVATLDMTGAGVLQNLRARLRPSWGTLIISARPAGAQVSVDGREQALAPATVHLEAGVHRIRLTYPGLEAWESNIVIDAGGTLRAGTITLGQPDAQLVVHSEPEGADVSIARTFRGRTPLVLSLPSGIEHDIVLSRPGYRSWTRTVLAEPAKRLALTAHLQPILFEVSIRGAPAGAELRVDGASKGLAPKTLELLAVEHRIEVRKQGYVPLITDVSPTPGLASTVQYHLIVSDRSMLFEQSAPIIATRTGYILRIVPSGAFIMGGGAAHDRGSSASGRVVKLVRPFYIGLRAVTNAEFRAFRPDHAGSHPGNPGGSAGAARPVTRISWDDAVAYCNWLSRRDGLEPAYRRRGGTYVLVQPVTTGYRLPTEAEWEYAARRLVSPAAHGAYAVSGNIAEWVNDFYRPSIEGMPATDPLGPVTGVRHVVRAWSRLIPVGSGRGMFRRDGGNGPSGTVGFRIARYAE